MNYLAMDLGGTDIKFAMLTKNGEIVHKDKVPTPDNTKMTVEGLVDLLVQIITPYLPQIKGVALSLPGVLDSDTGHSFTGGSFYYLAGDNLPKRLMEKIPLPVTVENDGKAAALAEFWQGSLKDVTNGAAVILGTAVGGGLIINREIYKGSTYAAGELSFLLTNPETDTYWGGHGGARALVKTVNEMLEKTDEPLDGYGVFELAEAGDVAVLNAIDTYTSSLAKQLYNLQTLLDLDLIAIGGGISRQPLLMKYLQKNIDDFCNNHPFKPFMPAIPTPKITTCTHFNQANLIGALYHHLKQITPEALND